MSFHHRTVRKRLVALNICHPVPTGPVSGTCPRPVEVVNIVIGINERRDKPLANLWLG